MENKNVIILNNKHLQNQSAEKITEEMNRPSDPEHLKKVWGHVCPGVGLIVLMDSTCSKCLKTKGKE